MSIVEQLPIIPVLLFSVIIHEIAHGWMALKLGDPTAKMMGRLTLNPVPHIDPVGSILIPLLSLMAAGQVLIAWAKPVPVNPANFKHQRRDDVLVSAVGPLSNLVMAFVCSLAVGGLVLLMADAAPGSPLASPGMEFLLTMFRSGVVLNVVLAVFNLIPVPPLDGSHILASLLPSSLAMQFRRIGFFGVLLLLFLLRIPVVSSAFNAVIRLALEPFRALIGLFL